MKPRAVLFGTSTFGIPSFSALADSGIVQIVAVVTQPARPVGRKAIMTPTPIAAWAENIKLPILTFASLKTPDAVQKLTAFKPELFIVASYGLILPAAILAIPAHQSINLHASLLPKYRGASPIAAAIATGDAQTGVTFMLMDQGCDTGSMLRPITVPIQSGDTRPILEQRLAMAASQNVVPIVQQWLAGELKPVPQPATGFTLAPKLSRDDGRAVWDDASALERKIRAYTPWPGVWTTWRGQEFKLLSATSQPITKKLTTGTIVATANGWSVVCMSGLLTPTSVQFSGRQPQPAQTIPGGYPGFIGSRLV